MAAAQRHSGGWKAIPRDDALRLGSERQLDLRRRAVRGTEDDQGRRQIRSGDPRRKGPRAARTVRPRPFTRREFKANPVKFARLSRASAYVNSCVVVMVAESLRPLGESAAGGRAGTDQFRGL